MNIKRFAGCIFYLEGIGLMLVADEEMRSIYLHYLIVYPTPGFSLYVYKNRQRTFNIWPVSRLPSGIDDTSGPALLIGKLLLNLFFEPI
jgi:hypothetical protein